jgi:phage terminase large subunit-like protein
MNVLENIGFPEHPVLFGGVDIGHKSDTTAVTFVYRDPRNGHYFLWDYKTWVPTKQKEADLIDVENTLFRVLENHNVAKLLFDPSQFATTNQKLRSAGYKHKLVEVNQQTENVAFMNCLKTHLVQGTVSGIVTGDFRAHFKYANVRATERGWRVEKRRQSRPIDLVISTGMALWSCTEASGTYTTGNFTESRHCRSLASAA